MQALRRFEQVLLAELGYAIRFDVDVLGLPIQPAHYYRYNLGEGFSQSSSGEAGSQLLALSQSVDILSPDGVAILSRVYRRVISALLGDRPLKSRELWISSQANTTLSIGQAK